MSHATPLHLNLTQLKKQAKELLKAHHSGDHGTTSVLRRLPRFAAAPAPEILAADVNLSDVQFALAKEHGFDSWAHLKRFVEGVVPRPQAELMRQDGATWISHIPTLGWGLDRDCTFVGSFEAALAGTNESFSYADLMGFSGLIFRIRWSPTFCPSCAVGEMSDEEHGITRCSGWGLQTEHQFGQPNPDRQAIRRKLTASIDSGLPILAYGICMDMSVIYGYEDDSHTLWLTDYHAKGQMPYKLPLDKLGPMQMYLVRSRPSLTPAGQLRSALELAVRNWNIGQHDDGMTGRDYRYGPLAYDGWLEAIRNFDRLSSDQIKQLHYTHHFVWTQLTDARRAAAEFLNDRLDLVNGQALESLQNAIRYCSAEAKRLYHAFDHDKLFTGPLADWTADKRLQECEIVEGMKHEDNLIHTELKRAMTAME